ncbi:hypothetical protein RYX36_031327, partial [Vicia faba]
LNGVEDEKLEDDMLGELNNDVVIGTFDDLGTIEDLNNLDRTTEHIVSDQDDILDDTPYLVSVQTDLVAEGLICNQEDAEGLECNKEDEDRVLK